MPYSAPISRASPACILLLIDQSKSMEDPFAGATESKAKVVSDAVNRLVQNLVLRSAKADGVRDYFRIGAIGYGKAIRTVLGGTLPRDILIPISRLADHPLRIEDRKKLAPDGAGGVIEQVVKLPVWFDPEASGPTPMCEAMAAAAPAIEEFVRKHPDSFPPIILNLTDGMPSDGNPQQNARALRQMKTSDGNVLLFNLQLTKQPRPPGYFLADESLLGDTFSKLLFRMSSPLPPPMADTARSEGFAVEPGARGVVLNADPTAVVRFLDIGTRVASAVR